MNKIITDYKPEFDNALEHLKTDLNSIRGNRAHPSIVEDIKVEVYGSEMSVKELASITVPEPRLIQVQPWDKNALKELEKGLREADLNVGIQNDGELLRLSFAPLTTESRQELLKLLGQKLEAGRVRMRQARERAREAIIKAEKTKEITEDDRFAAQKDLDELVKAYLDQIKEIGEKKEEEIMTI